MDYSGFVLQNKLSIISLNVIACNYCILLLFSCNIVVSPAYVNPRTASNIHQQFVIE